eukprot:TRINITY_DN16699_c0_g1_i1.p1 TRINITY_DN16699_c0_g1~~TRINITY_DN16699_c0_g1_i1.p1  ORF type:complete len:300 (-),score=26.30 TRINITY_DN16699_c0_g1_i1:2-826(-)
MSCYSISVLIATAVVFLAYLSVPLLTVFGRSNIKATMTVIKDNRRFAVALFDLDDTLYHSEEIGPQVKENIKQYMHEHLRIPEEELEEKCVGYHVEYGTTLSGLVAHGHDIDYDHFHSEPHAKLDYVHMLDKPDPRLREAISAIELPRYVFTNADNKHATTILEILGLDDLFEGVIDFERVQAAAQAKAEEGKELKSEVVCKPQPLCYKLVMEMVGVQDPAEVLFMDDSIRNVKKAREMGMFTVFIGSKEEHEGADISVETCQSTRLDLFKNYY